MPELVSTASSLGLWALLGYLLGSIPFGIVISRVMGLGDLRNIGSGNIGATNVLRTGNKAAAAGTLILDGAKGALAVVVARSFAADDAAQVAGLMAFMGHCFPVWLGFRGGKGVATFLGLLLVLSFPVGLAACGSWLAGAALTRMSSAAALIAAALAVVWAWGLAPTLVVFTALLAIIVWLRHKDNIARILQRTEPKIGQK